MVAAFVTCVSVQVPLLAEAAPGVGFPRKTQLLPHPDDPSDSSIRLGLLPYHALAPQLNEMQASSDRVSVEVIGKSVQDRELYQVTVTLPETAAQAREQERWRDLISDDPAAAASDSRLLAEYKTPVWINNNIHGDEWEGTDAAMRMIRDLATTTDPKALDLLARNRIVVNVTANPDGRVAGRRENAAGFDLNRDNFTSSQPENAAARDLDIRIQPVLALDLHGYIEGTLIEPSNPPHNQNYEYDLQIKPAYENALGIEQAVKALGYPEAQDTQIPFRDYTNGWDDWSPSLTAQYAPFHGAVGQTIELPLRVDAPFYSTLPVEELQRRSKINVAVASAVIRGSLDYVRVHRADLLKGQIEQFRRGRAGEPLRWIPDGFVPGFGPEDRSTTTFPRAYVIAAKPDVATARLVNHLIAQDIEVTRTDRAAVLGGRSYPAGTYLVDMHQPKRGLANALLEAGTDITSRTGALTDTAAWSLGCLWGAQVDTVVDGDINVPRHPVSGVTTQGSVAARPGQDMGIVLRDATDVSAVNDLLTSGVPLRRLADGTIVAPASARSAVERVADSHKVRFSAADGMGTDLKRPVIAAAAGEDQQSELRAMGFEVRPVSTQLLNEGFDLSGVDVLWITTSLRYDLLTPEAKGMLDVFFGHGAVITQGFTGAAFNEAAGLLEVTTEASRMDTSGVIHVTNEPGQLGGSAPTYTFGFGTAWFTGLGPGVHVEQRFGPRDPLLAGFWPPLKSGGGVAADAAGQPSIVSGVDERGARVVLFGTTPLFRAHNKGLVSQVANAVYWSVSR